MAKFNKSRARPTRDQTIGKKSSIIRDKNIEIKEGYGHDRLSRIENCEDCKGNPPLVDFEIPEFKGKRCKLCWEIVSYKRK